MTNTEHTAVPLSLAEVHHATFWPEAHRDLPVNALETLTWSEVTCGACRLEMPEDKAGRPEHFVPADVLERDAGLVKGDRVKRLERRLATIETVIETTREVMNTWAARHGEALALREATVIELRSTVTDERAPVVPVEGVSGFEAATAVSAGEGAEWLVPGVRFEIIPTAGAHLRRTGTLGNQVADTLRDGGGPMWRLTVEPRFGMEGWSSVIHESDLRAKRFGTAGTIRPIS